MKNAVFALTILFSAQSIASSEGMNEFLQGFPDEMSCDGVERSAITDSSTALREKVTIKLSGKDSKSPEIEVISPSSSELLRHFKMGNGYVGTLSQGLQSYVFSKQVIYFLRATVSGEDATMSDVLRARSTGGLVSFSRDRIGGRAFHWIKLSNCQAVD